MPMLTTRRCVGQKAALCHTMLLCLSVDIFFSIEQVRTHWQDDGLDLEVFSFLFSLYLQKKLGMIRIKAKRTFTHSLLDRNACEDYVYTGYSLFYTLSLCHSSLSCNNNNKTLLHPPVHVTDFVQLNALAYCYLLLVYVISYRAQTAAYGGCPFTQLRNIYKTQSRWFCLPDRVQKLNS